jgi:quinoprotein glucose dehydrogenase
MIIYRVIIVIWSCIGIFGCGNKQDPHKSWETYQGDPGSNQYSSLKQINKSNVDQLEVAWVYQTGDNLNKQSQIQCNPIIVDDILYATSPTIKLIALRAATGELLWEFDPALDFSPHVNRGVTYWESGNDKRILFTAGSLLFAINAITGKPVVSFGTAGVTSLKAGLGARAADLFVISTSPGVIYKNLYIIGTRVSENADAAPGYIRAFNARTGAVEWVFHTIPKPGEYGYETWPENAYEKIGGANAWAGISLDVKRGVVYAPTGSASFDFWGGNRKGSNLFANCIIAINAENGQRLWHYQTVHHDLWDRDLPTTPNLVTVTHNGVKIDAVAQVTKSGYVFLLDRDTGKPLFTIEERPVKKSDLKGEETWPTQPFPVKPPPFSRQHFSEEEITDISPEAHEYVKTIWTTTRTGEQFIPPSTVGTMYFPGFDGGAEWGGASYDSNTGVLYVNANEMPWIQQMVELQLDMGDQSEPKIIKDAGEKVYKTNCAICHGQSRQGNTTGIYPPLLNLNKRLPRETAMAVIEKGKGFMPSYNQFSNEKKNALLAYLYNDNVQKSQENDGEQNWLDNLRKELLEFAIPYSHTGYNRFFDQEGYPAVKPLWGTLNAIDLNKGEILWQVPLGEFEELTERGIPKTGTENYGGPVATAGGLIFIAASKDGYIRAFDKDTGTELWKHKLPAGGYATPSVFAVDRRQYVVIACGGGKMGTAPGDYYVAFALPQGHLDAE